MFGPTSIGTYAGDAGTLVDKNLGGYAANALGPDEPRGLVLHEIIVTVQLPESAEADIACVKEGFHPMDDATRRASGPDRPLGSRREPNPKEAVHV